MPEGAAFAAVDLGAESGRVALGHLTEGRVELELVHRFANRPVRLPDGLHWNLLDLFANTLEGLSRAAAASPLRGVGVEAWGVDYGLLDGDMRLLGPPFHYRDERTEGMAARAYARVAREELYAVTGIQTMPINTVFQLLADEGSAAVASAQRIALVPDLFGLWLTGELVNEETVASTTGLLDARTGQWARDIVERLGLPTAFFHGPLVAPGTAIGPILPAHADAAGGAVGVGVGTVAGHDTASAFAATPLAGPDAAVLSSGTWSLLGLEADAPELGELARSYNLTNERGLDGTTRLLRNVMGLWIIQQCRLHWERSGGPADYDDLHQLAAAAGPEVPLFDPDAPVFLAPGDMPARIANACRKSGQQSPAGPGECVRSVLLSLACKYRLVLERLRRVTGRELRTLHVVGGGARNELLCRLTADVTRLAVLAGPVEATALGNVLVQARAAGELGSLSDIRAVAGASANPTRYEPSAGPAAEETYERFLAVTGLAVDASDPVAA